MYVQPKLISRRLKSEKSKMFKVHSRYIGLMSCAELNHLLLNWTLKSLASPASQAPPSPQSGVSWNSRSRPFPRITASDSRSESECFFSFSSHSRILGMFFFIPLPFPNCGNENFSFPFRSRIAGMDFFHSLHLEFAISQSGMRTGIGVL